MNPKSHSKKSHRRNKESQRLRKPSRCRYTRLQDAYYHYDGKARSTMMTLGMAICHLAQKAFTLKSLTERRRLPINLEGNFQQSQTHTDRWQLRANCIYFCFVRCFFSPSFLGMELHRTLWQRVEAPEMRHQGLIPSPNLLLSHLHSSVFVEAELNATAGRNELNCICTTN